VPTIFAYLISGICVAGLVTIWFVAVYKELSSKRNALADLKEQTRLHEGLFLQVRDSPNAKAAAEMLKTSRMLYCEAAKVYNLMLRKPINRLPALLMGFRATDDMLALGHKSHRRN